MWRWRLGCTAVIVAGVLCAVAPTRATVGQCTSTKPSPAAEERGRAVFNGTGHCTSCHRVAEVGSGVGPNLTNVGGRLTMEQLRKAILAPDPALGAAYRSYKVVTRAGKVVRGKLLNQDPYSIQMLDSDGNLVAFDRSALREAGFEPATPMPSYKSRLTPQQQADLLTFLASLRGSINQ
jgi:quinoprotein glucose dehydrogenase